MGTSMLKMGRAMQSRNWTIGESVVVKPGVADPDTGRDIGGWQARISAILDEAEILTLQWDSLTLKSIPPTHLAWLYIVPRCITLSRPSHSTENACQANDMRALKEELDKRNL